MTTHEKTRGGILRSVIFLMMTSKLDDGSVMKATSELAAVSHSLATTINGIVLI